MRFTAAVMPGRTSWHRHRVSSTVTRKLHHALHAACPPEPPGDRAVVFLAGDRVEGMVAGCPDLHPDDIHFGDFDIDQQMRQIIDAEDRPARDAAWSPGLICTSVTVPAKGALSEAVSMVASARGDAGLRRAYRRGLARFFEPSISRWASASCGFARSRAAWAFCCRTPAH